MTTSGFHPIGLEELSAYVDGELDNGRRTAVEKHLSNDADLSRRVALYRRNDDDLRQAFALLAQSKPLETIDISRLRRNHHRRKTVVGLAMAASVLMAVFTGAVWWLWQDRARELMMADLAHQAAIAHMSYLSKPALVDDKPTRARLADRLRRIAGTGASVPSFTSLDYAWVGGTLMGTDDAPALLFVYRNGAGNVVSCYFRASRYDGETEYAVKKMGGINIVYRLEDGVGYSVTGSLPPARLMILAKRGYATVFDEDWKTPINP